MPEAGLLEKAISPEVMHSPLELLLALSLSLSLSRLPSLRALYPLLSA